MIPDRWSLLAVQTTVDWVASKHLSNMLKTEGVLTMPVNIFAPTPAYSEEINGSGKSRVSRVRFSNEPIASNEQMALITSS